MQNVNEMPACIHATITACVHAVVEAATVIGGDGIESIATASPAQLADIAEQACARCADWAVTMPDGREVPTYYVVRRFFDELVTEAGGY